MAQAKRCPQCGIITVPRFGTCPRCNVALEAIELGGAPAPQVTPGVPYPPAAQKGAPRARWLLLGLVVVLLVACAAVIGFVLFNPSLGQKAAELLPILGTVLPATATPTPAPLPTIPAVQPGDKPLPTVPFVPAAHATATELPLDVRVEHDSVYTAGGTYLISGEVANRSGQNLESVRVVASLYDAEDTLVDTEFALTLLDIVPRGENAPFVIDILDAPAAIERYELELQYKTTADEPLRVEILGHRGARNGQGTYTVEGEVRNAYDFELGLVQIIATGYDEAGKVLTAGFTFVPLETLPAGQTSAFELSLVEAPPNLHHYGLQSQAELP